MSLSWKEDAEDPEGIHRAALFSFQWTHSSHPSHREGSSPPGWEGDNSKSQWVRTNTCTATPAHLWQPRGSEQAQKGLNSLLHPGFPFAKGQAQREPGADVGEVEQKNVWGEWSSVVLHSFSPHEDSPSFGCTSLKWFGSWEWGR